jgi:DNA-binding CsgD family transcriptional regulator
MGLHPGADSSPHAELKDWLRGPVRAAVPHQSALVLHGSAHSLGFAIEQRICVDLAQNYLAGLCNSSGQIQGPMARRWMQTRESQYFDLHDAAEGQGGRWLQNFSAHGLWNCALFGLVDAAGRRVTLLGLYNVQGGSRAARPELCMPFLEPLQSALAQRAHVDSADVLTLSGAGQMTPAELEVLKWVRLGKTNNEIGMILGRSRYTVKTHIQRMLAKTGLDNRTQLSDFARPREPENTLFGVFSADSP